MRIITWNCNMAFRNKAAAILAFDPDILVIPECEHPYRLKFPTGVPTPNDSLWFGKNQHKGLGIFSYSGFRFKKRRSHKPELKTIIPVAVSNGVLEFDLYAIWAYNPDDPDGVYVEQVWKAIQHYQKHFTKRPVILAGDFNSNTIWDKKHRIGNHTDVVNQLEKKNIYSAYHLHHGQVQGKEEHPTWYMYRHENKPYHLDYCFASKILFDKIVSVEIGSYKEWRKYSDHVPVIVTFSTE